MADQRLMMEHARNYLRSHSGAGEDDLRAQLRQRFLLEDDQGLTEGAARAAGRLEIRGYYLCIKIKIIIAQYDYLD